MLAFTNATIPEITASLDFLNIMTYDMMNRRDSITKHHTGLELSLNAVNAYEKNGLPTEKVNLGFAFYIKWYRTNPHGGCENNSIGCKTVFMEDPLTGADLGQAGAFSWHDPVPDELSASYEKALAYGKYDSGHGGHYYWDQENNLWWSWDTPDAITKKLRAITERKHLGGVFAWGLGEDADNFTHLEALTAGVKKYLKVHGGEKRALKSAHLPSSGIKSEL
jgi:GH18 family chitinase